MKKLAAIICVIACVCALIACAGENVAGEGDTKNPLTTTERDIFQETEIIEIDTAADEAQDEEQKWEDEAITTEQPDEEDDNEYKSFRHGTVNGRIYENETLKIGLKLSENWEYSSDEEIAETNNITSLALENMMNIELISGKDMLEMLATRDVDSVNITIRKMNAMLSVLYDMGRLKISDIYDEEFMENEIELMEQAGYTINDYYQNKEVVFPVEDFVCYDFDATYLSYDLVFRTVTFFSDGYMASITITTDEKIVLDEVVDCFYNLDKISLGILPEIKSASMYPGSRSGTSILEKGLYGLIMAGILGGILFLLSKLKKGKKSAEKKPNQHNTPYPILRGGIWVCGEMELSLDFNIYEESKEYYTCRGVLKKENETIEVKAGLEKMTNKLFIDYSGYSEGDFNATEENCDWLQVRVFFEDKFIARPVDSFKAEDEMTFHQTA